MSYNKLNREKKFDKLNYNYKNHPNYKDIKKLYMNNIITRIDSTEKLFNKIKLTKAGKLYKTSEKLSIQLGKQSQTFKVEATIKRFNKDSKTRTIKNMTPVKLESIINNLDLRKNVVLKAGNKFYTLTPNNVKSLSNEIYYDTAGGYTSASGSDQEFVSFLRIVKQITIIRPEGFHKSHNQGAFFNHYCKYPELDLKQLQIYSEKQNTYDENCFVEAIKQSGILSDIEMNDLRAMIKTIYVPTNVIRKICNKFNLYIEIKNIKDTKNVKSFGDCLARDIVICLIDKHYFIQKKLPYNIFAIKNIDHIKHLPEWNKIYRYCADKKCYKKSERFINSFDLVKYMFENKEQYLKELPYSDFLATQYYSEASPNIIDLEYSESSVRETKLTNKTNKIEITKNIFYDFETTTEGESHKAYLVCTSETEPVVGEKCGLVLLRRLYEKFNKDYDSLTLIAHNGGYDMRFLQEFFTLTNLIERSTQLLQCEGFFNYSKGKTLKIILKNSYTIITMPLSNFGKAFNLPQQKDIIPYCLYTQDSIKLKLISFDVCRKCCDIQVNQNLIHKKPTQYEYDDFFNKFMNNATINDCIVDDKVDIIKYSIFYCQKDVEVLQLGYEKFDSILNEATGLSIYNYMSSAQLAHQFMLDKNVFDGVYQLSSTPRDYIMKAMVGGRTMCADNKKHHKIGRMQDFDAVSLYPSAMSRLGGYLLGKPKVLKNLNYEWLKNNTDGYYIQIKINAVNKNYHFPLMNYKDDNGTRIFSNDMINKNIFVCKIELEDLIEFHKIEFTIIDGYYYNEGRNNKLGEVIDFVFNERLKMKKEKNTIEQIYKLIMNSSYGKTLQKPIEENVVFKTSDDIDKFVDKNYNFIKNYEQLNNDDDDVYKKYIIKVLKPIDEHYNYAHCGVEVLAMSKRIMNEVMCTAEDNDIDIFYQDTDSMHLFEKDIDKLEKIFDEKYNRKLIGKGMGQFHSDFDSSIIVSDIHASESIFLGKKCYIDKLEGFDKDGNKAVDYHIRMKGISNKSILYKSLNENRKVIDIFKSLYDNNTEAFDLACEGNKTCFQFNKNMTITSKFSFIREVKFL
jgi:hypothetical protein